MGVRNLDRIFNQGGISTYSTPEEAVRAFSHLVSYARNRSVLYETPRSFPISFACGHNRLVEEGRRILAEGGEILSERDSKTLLELYQIPTVMPRVAVSEEGAVVEARNVGYPVAIKVLSPDISHKTDVGGVALNIASDDQLRSAFRQVVESAQGAKPDARIRGVVVEPMVTAADGIELILGVKKDAVFGPVLMLGAGGIAAEVLGDCSLELPPLNERLARRMIESLRIWPLLRGYRGRPAANIDKLIEVLLRLSCLVADHAAIGELDINPLLVTPHGVTALDARIVVDAHALQQPGRPYGHLAILPYPEQYVRQAALRDGRRIVLRPIRPEDEPLWIKMIAQCSPESIWFRFRHVFQEMPHEVAARFCFLDYDREIALVAEITSGEERAIIGTGRLLFDPDRQRADYAVLVADPWQSLGLGGLLTDHCMDIARGSGVREVTAEATADNGLAIRLFTKRGFTIEGASAGESVLARKSFGGS